MSAAPAANPLLSAWTGPADPENASAATTAPPKIVRMD